MATSLSLSRRAFLIARLRPRFPTLHPLPPLPLHGTAAIPTATNTTAAPSLFRNLHQTTHEPQNSLPFSSSLVLAGEERNGKEEDVEDEAMNEFLSRFVWKMRKKICEAYPGIDSGTCDGMLLVIAQKVVSRMERGGGGGGELLGLGGSALALAEDPSLDLSPHLWVTAWEVSESVLEDMSKMRKRGLMKRFLHSENVKGMCHFAAEVGIRGDMLREFRFKWALEEMEEWEFFQGLRQRADVSESSGTKPELDSLPQRHGKIKYKIHGLNLSDTKWIEVTDRVHEAEKLITPEEPKSIMGKCKLVTERILDLGENDDPSQILAEWAELLEPKRADWLALLDRIKEHNQTLYFKVAEHLLGEESLQTNIRDYSRLMEVHVEADRIDDAERILQKMAEKGIKSDILTSIILVHMYSNAGNLDRAKEEFESLRNQGFRPDVEVYKSMIRAYLKVGLVKSGELLMKEMETLNIKPPKEMYIELLRAFAQRGQVDGAQRIFNTMQFFGIQQTSESSTLLIEAYGQVGDPDQARNTFDYMVKSGHKPDDRSVASMIAAYEKKNLLDRALDLLLNLEKDGFKPGIATYHVLVDWLGRLLLVDEVEDLMQKIAEKGDPPFNIHVSLCDMYSKAGVEDKALKSLEILLERKEQLNGSEFERVISGLLVGGHMQEAKKVHEVMQAQGLNSSEPIKVALMASETITRQKPRKK